MIIRIILRNIPTPNVPNKINVAVIVVNNIYSTRKRVKPDKNSSDEDKPSKIGNIRIFLIK